MKTKAVITLILISLFVFENQVEAQAEKDVTNESMSVNIYFINGYAVSFDFYKHDNSAMRLHLDFNGTDLSDESKGDRYGSNSADEKITDERNFSTFAVSVSPQYYFTFFNSVNVSSYLSFGPLFGYESGHDEQKFTVKKENFMQEYVTITNENTVKNTSWKIGAVFSIGLKGKLTDNIGLFAESYFDLTKRWTTNDIDIKNTDYYYTYKSETSGGGWKFETNFVRAGISISF